MFVTSGSRSTRRRFGLSTNAPLALNFGTITSNPGEPTPGMALSIYGTYNNGAVTFTAPLFMSVTNTASGGSTGFGNNNTNLIDFRVGNNAKFVVDVNGRLKLNPTNTTPFGNSNDPEVQISTNGGFASGGSGQVVVTAGGAGAIPMTWTATGTLVGTAFLQFGGASLLCQDGAQNTLQMANGTNAQSLRVYNTTDQSGTNVAPTNYERGIFDWVLTTNTLTIGTVAGGTGTTRSVVLQAGASNTITINPGAGTAINFSTTCAFLAGSTLADINNTGALRFYPSADISVGRVAGHVLGFGDASGPNTTGWFNWGGQQRVTSDFSRSNSTAATAITGISSISVGQSSNVRNYKFEAWLATAGSTVGGISIAITCTSTSIAAISADGFILDGNTVRGNQGVITSTTTPVVNSSAITSSAPTVRLSGLLRGVSSGTFGLSLAQSTANATAVIVSSGSWLEVFDVP